MSLYSSPSFCTTLTLEAVLSMLLSLFVRFNPDVGVKSERWASVGLELESMFMLTSRS